MVVSRQSPSPVASPRAQQDLPLEGRLVDARLADPPEAGLEVPREVVDEEVVRRRPHLAPIGEFLVARRRQGEGLLLERRSIGLGNRDVELRQPAPA